MQQHRSPSIVSGGSRASVYSHYTQGSTARSTRSLATLGHSRGTSLKATLVPWYRRPLVTSAFYTDLTSGALHAVTFSIVVALWTFVTASFDAYCLDQAAPGASHTGYYLFSFDFVYVGNHHVRNLLMMAALVSILASIALFVAGCVTLNALRLEKETGLTPWLYTMAAFIAWKTLTWGYGTIVNDLIFGYHLFTFFIWLLLNTAGVASWVVVYSLFLELRAISTIERSARMKMDTMGSSRAHSLYGSRPTTPHLAGQGRAPGAGAYDPYTVEGDYCVRINDMEYSSRVQGRPASTSTPRALDLPPPLPSCPPPQEPMYASIPRRPGEYSYDTEIY